MRDVRVTLADSLGGYAACQALGIDAPRLDQAAREAWREVGCARYEDADEAIQSSVIERAHEFLAVAS